MKCFLPLVLVLLVCTLPVKADHITGGEIFYTFAGSSNGIYHYNVTVKLFMRCNSGREFNNPAIISVFNQATRARIKDFSVSLGRIDALRLNNTNVCITNPPPVCFEVGYYQFEISVPASADGYIITAQVVFRVDGMNNLISNYNQVGATYTAVIPSTASSATAPENNSARFTGDDLVVMCAGNPFTYSFAATDKDGDELRYSFCNAYQTQGVSPGNNSTPPPPPPYQSVPYGNGYSGNVPLGNDVHINASSGLISGVAPDIGTYVITVCVEEIRNGTVIAVQRKDIQINITSCSIAAAALPKDYILCGDTRTLTTRNISTSPLINTYNWEFIDNKGLVVFTSTEAVPSHTFADTGTYKIKLVINGSEQCADSTASIARVYPGFVPAFDVVGSCINHPVQFTENTSSGYGSVNEWIWEFGEASTGNDISSERNPSYSYTQSGNKNVRLITADSKGCRDTLTKAITIFDKPPIKLAFSDTLICPPDALVLNASGNGNFRWTPQINISNENTPQPLVSPLSTTRYYVELDDQGCINNDSVLIRVVDHVSLETMPDTVICRGDSLRLSIISDGLRFSWTPATDIINSTEKTPLAIPANNTTYIVTSSISNCIAAGEINVQTVPYPSALAGRDTLICFNTSALLHAETDGSSFTWRPDPALTSLNSLTTVATPISTTDFIIYAYDTRGCPKPGIDTVKVTVLKDIQAFAGRDTAIVIGQPLQLKASGGIRYAWTPTVGLNAPDIADPVALFHSAPAENNYRYKVVVYNEAGCADSAYIFVRIFSTYPDIFVPSAFTPNGDGRNDVFEPVSAGMSGIHLFQVYNRWGQLLYTSSGKLKPRWDGTFQRKLQDSGTFIWVLKATDFTGVPFIKKGTVTLIR